MTECVFYIQSLTHTTLVIEDYVQSWDVVDAPVMRVYELLEYELAQLLGYFDYATFFRYSEEHLLLLPIMIAP